MGGIEDGLILRIRVLTFEYVCMVLSWACIISYYNLISRFIFPSENINSQFYKHMFQIIPVLTQHNSITCINEPTLPCSHTHKNMHNL